MTSLVTPSAKSHERVKGRWVRDIAVNSPREWTLYYIKQFVGTPVPWLFSALACLLFISRAGVEVAAWLCALLTGIYIIVDRMSSNREFTFFRLGSDFLLLGYLLIVLIRAVMTESLTQALATAGDARWVLLLYLISYCWELFPGINRIFSLVVGSAVVVSIYAIWQHFTGMDLVRGQLLPFAPAIGHAYFTVSGLFGTPELFATLIASVLPFLSATFLLSEEQRQGMEKWLALLAILILTLAIFWTYRPGLWMAAIGGVLATILLKARGTLTLLGSLTALIGAVLFLTYESPDVLLKSVQEVEIIRAAEQRKQINTQVTLWQENPWLGVGHQAVDASNYDPGTGNVYFQVLAQAGILGLGFYLLFILAFMLTTYRIFREIPETHYWHRVFVAGALGAQIAFHMAGLYWSTLAEAIAVNFFVLVLSIVAYLSAHYERGLVPDDQSL